MFPSVSHFALIFAYPLNKEGPYQSTIEHMLGKQMIPASLVSPQVKSDVKNGSLIIPWRGPAFLS